jgi:hypothetical protein
MKGNTVSHKRHGKSEHLVTIHVEREGDGTRATASLRWHDVDLVGIGNAELEDGERYPKRVGEELAVARALTHLTRQLFVNTAGDIEDVTGESISIR